MEVSTDKVLEFRAKRFFEVLRENSFDKQDPVSEWQFVDIVHNDGTNKCICTAPILHLYRIQNRETKKSLIIGSECVKRWLNGILRCQRCSCTLGNITQRLRKQNFNCRRCKKLIQNEEESKRAEILKSKGKLRLLWYGPYYQKLFSEVIQDIPYVEKLVNIEPKTKTLQLFEEYAHLVYTIETVPSNS